MEIVLECLQKSLRIADGCMDSSMNVKLFVEILNEYLYYFEHKNEAVTFPFLCLFSFYLLFISFCYLFRLQLNI